MRFVLPDCPRDFYLGLVSARPDKHSDFGGEYTSTLYGNGCCRGFSPQFPYPRIHRPAVHPTMRKSTMRRAILLCCIHFTLKSDTCQVISSIKSNSCFGRIKKGTAVKSHLIFLWRKTEVCLEDPRKVFRIRKTRSLRCFSHGVESAL